MALRRHLNDIRNHNWDLIMASIERLSLNGVECGWKSRWICFRDDRRQSFMLAEVEGVFIGPARRRNLRRKLRQMGVTWTAPRGGCE